MPWYWRISLLGIVLFFYNSETFVIFHQGNFVDEFDRDWYSELLMPEVDDIVFNIEVVLLIDHLIGSNRLACWAVVFLEKTHEVVHCIALPVSVDIDLALSTHNANYFTIFYFDKVLGVITDEWMCEVPKVGTDHAADTIGDGIIIVVKYFNDAVVSCDVVVAIMNSCLVAIGSALATVGIYNVAAKSLFYLRTVG